MSTSSKHRRLPGLKSHQLAERLRQVESRNITWLGDDFPVFWESARGARVTDVDGHRYLDLTSAFAVASLGHQAPVIRRALQRQCRKMWHGMGDVHPSAVKVELLEALRNVTPGDLSVTILSSSGAEAVESALKTARLATGKPGIIAFNGAYHGLSYGTLAVTDRESFRTPFANQIPALAVHSPFPDPLHGISEDRCLDALQRFLQSGYTGTAGPIGAILVEPIQGRGGVLVPQPSFLRDLQSLARQYQLVLIADEIFTGFGRTGLPFAVDHSHVVPDLMCLGKALTNGFPLSACIGTSDVMQAWPMSDGEAIHTSTYLGNPMGCAMALAAIKEFRVKHLAQRAARVGASWKRKLERALGDHPNVAEIRGCGLMLGVELVQNRKTLQSDADLAQRIVKECLQQGVMVLSGGDQRNVLTLTPPLTITEQELSQATSVLIDVIKSLPNVVKLPQQTEVLA